MSQSIRLLDRVVDLPRRAVTGSGTSVRLSPTECRLLVYMAANPGRPLSSEELLTEVWGYRATVNSRTVTSTVHRLRLKIEQDPHRPRHLLTVYGGGYRFELLDPEPAGVGVPPHCLPSEGLSLVGRETLLVRLHDELAASQVVLLHGPGGIGKTALATAYGYRYLTSWAPGGVWWCDLSDCATVLDCAAAVALVVGAEPGLREADLAAAVGLALSCRTPALIVVDGADGLASILPSLLDVWTDHAPNVRWLVTTRVDFSAGNASLEVPQLDVDASVASARAAATQCSEGTP